MRPGQEDAIENVRSADGEELGVGWADEKGDWLHNIVDAGCPGRLSVVVPVPFFIWFGHALASDGKDFIRYSQGAS